MPSSNPTPNVDEFSGLDPLPRKLFTVPETAALLGLSESWIRRHKHQLPVVRLGRLVRFDSVLLIRQFQSKQKMGNRLKQERNMMILQLQRYQRGYVYKTGKKQKVWYGMWREDVQRPEGGISRRQKHLRLGTLTELPTRAAALQELTRRKGEDKPLPVEMTFVELFERWKAVVVPTIRETTAAYYLKELNRHIVPAFRERNIQLIGRYEIETFLAERAAIFCRNTLRGMRVSLGRVLSWAVDCGWLQKNSCSGVKLPRAGTKVVRMILKPEQTRALAGKLEEPYATLVLFLAVTGLRISEAIGIKWSDFDGNALRISRRIYEGQAGETKTSKSVRSLPIPEALVIRMRKLGEGQWVFRSRAGTTVNPGNALKRYIHPASRELGFHLGGWHDFRHTMATQSMMNGTPTKVVSEILGHSDVLTTMKIYQHTSTETLRGPLIEMSDTLLRDVTKTDQSVAGN
jgi:integrase